MEDADAGEKLRVWRVVATTAGVGVAAAAEFGKVPPSARQNGTDSRWSAEFEGGSAMNRVILALVAIVLPPVIDRGLNTTAKAGVVVGVS